MLKIHVDHSFKDTINFEELQEMARRCREAPGDSERRDALAWETAKGLAMRSRLARTSCHCKRREISKFMPALPEAMGGFVRTPR